MCYIWIVKWNYLSLTSEHNICPVIYYQFLLKLWSYLEVSVTLVVVQELEKISKNENNISLGRKFKLHFNYYHLNFTLEKLILKL